MIRRVPFVLIVCALLATAGSVRADVTPHPLFSDGAVLQRDMKVPVWGTADDGEEITVTIGSQTHTTTAKDGKWQITLEPQPANAEPQTLVISGKNTVEVKDVLIGEVWLCGGQSNMQWSLKMVGDETSIAAATNSNIRLISVPRAGAEKPQATAEIAWVACDPKHVADFTAVGYYFGRDLEESLEVPIGLINSNFGGTVVEAWTSQEGFEALSLDPELVTAETRVDNAELYLTAMQHWFEDLQEAKVKGEKPKPVPNPYRFEERLPMRLYNAMIAPLAPYAIRGVVWYQGESNVPNFGEYFERFPNMIKDWRSKWGYDFPFLFVQLAPFHAKRDEPGISGWASLREAQTQTLAKVPKTAMAVITDVGDEKDIHPRKKQPVGARLALAALGTVYGRDVEYSGPMYKSVEFKDGKAVVSFTHLGGGLVAKDGPLTGFTIAGKDEKFYNAEAEIDGDTIVVSCDEVDEPVAVRFGWDDYPVLNLWNQAGLPASPFRTDEFDLPAVDKL